MTIHSSVLDIIADTPIVKARRLDTGVCELYLKLESQNPGGSIKDRIGLKMIEAAEARGDIRPGDTLVEGTAGNTGIGLALVAQQKGYRLVLVIPDKMSREKIFNLKAMGAEVVLTRSDVPKGHPEHYQDLAASIAAKTPRGYHVNQFGNPDNPAAHAEGTGPEILRQMAEVGGVDAVVVGVGSGGTLTGLAQCFAEQAPEVELILADPAGSILKGVVETGEIGKATGSWLVEGIGEGSKPPPVADFSRVRKAYAIDDRESFLTARELLRSEGILAGSSTGTLLAAALHWCREQTTPKKILVFVCDTGNKY
ncbi:MAG TPA: PLP-dependent cysteine synthase family protein, partial [Gammaproteobacteria bacterium]|nr:PLP-dependent cysteine synthase family protein [Gammaproteobacteria bacterium]